MKPKTHRLFFSALVLLMFSVTQNNLPAQARLMFGTAATYMNISGGTVGTPIYLVVGNSAANAITGASATAGWIISEGEYNYVKWLGTTSPVVYTVPFGYSSTFYLPFTFNKTAGAASDLRVSSWASATNNTAWASGVANMYDQNVGGDGSIPAVIDRWWTINDAPAVSTANVTFSYRGLAENTTDGTFGGPTGNFGAQRWNGTVWEAPIGSNPGVTTGVGTVTASAVSAFSPWVLSKVLAPLPIQWLSLSTECERGDVTIKWSTATEQNSAYFTVERSLDGTNFYAIATKMAAGNSSTVQYYSAVDADPYSGVSFYRVKETDFNGASVYSGTIPVSGCSGDDVIIYGEDGGAVVNIHASADGQYNIEMYNALGQKITGRMANVAAGSNHIKLSPNNVASAIYLVKVYPMGMETHNSSNAATKKVFVRSDY